MSQIQEDESKYKAVFERKVSDNIFIMHFVNFNLKTEMPNVFCKQLETGLTSVTVNVVKLVFQNNHSNLFMTGP